MNAQARPRDIIAPVPRIAVGRDEAAASLGISRNLFNTMVDDGRMPRPRVVNGRRLWDADEVRVAFRTIPRDGDETSSNPWDMV